MKRLLTFLLAIGSLAAAPSEPLMTNTVTLSWTPSPDEQYIEATLVYFRTNFPPDMPITNAPLGEVMDWTPPASQSNQWQLLRVIPNIDASGNLLNVTNVTITNVWSSKGIAAFFTTTVSNRLGESPFSNVAWIPAAPSATRLKLLTLD